MKASWTLTTAMCLAGSLAIGVSHAASLPATDVAAPALDAMPDLILVQSPEPPPGLQDRIERLWQNRAIIEDALQAPRQAMPAEPLEPQARAIQPPEATVATVPEVPAVLPEPELSGGLQDRVSCEAAAAIVEDYGFSDIRTADCSGELYRFSATRDGAAYSIGVTASAGEIAEVNRE